MDTSFSKLRATVEDRGTWLLQSMVSQKLDMNLGTEQQQKYYEYVTIIQCKFQYCAFFPLKNIYSPSLLLKTGRKLKAKCFFFPLHPVSV